MTPQQFITKWSDSELSEKSGSHEHFLDVCRLVNHGTPAGLDKTGESFTFERGVEKTGGKNGWADVWKRGFFGWEYKGTNKDLQQHKTLEDAYRQLQLYRASLENPPLLVVCDMKRFVVYTNFTNTVEKKYEFDTQGLANEKNLAILRNVFFNPEALRPGQTRESITQQAAEHFGQLADKLRQRGVPAERAAHFLMKLMFCMFADDIGLLPNKTFTELLDRCKSAPTRFASRLAELFEAMRAGGEFGYDAIQRFNGGLFNDADVIDDLRPDEIAILARVNEYEWSDVEPSVFGTLFERTLDPAKRAQIGAHYTSRDDILTIVEPVVMTPLRRRWQEVQAGCEKTWSKLKSGGTKGTKTTRRKQLDRQLLDFIEELSHVRILDPACGSGNFLYVAIHLLLDLEKEVIAYAATRGIGLLPHVRPTQLAGIEINPYAQELASVVIWIGYLQWMHHNGFNPPRDPILEPIQSIRRMDAILDLSDPDNPREPEWPEAEFIVGNPPFLGGNRLRQSLGDEYVDSLFDLYRDRVPGFADLCCYWFEKSRDQIEANRCRQAGLLATQSIRGGVSRKVLERTKKTGDIFFAESDRDWILDGAMVHVSMVGFDDGSETEKTLDRRRVADITASLSSGIDVRSARRLPQFAEVHIEGVKKGADFELPQEVAEHVLSLPNPHGLPNSDVIRPYTNGMELYGGETPGWIVYFPPGSSETEAARYESPFEHVMMHIHPRYANKRKRWWIHERPRPELQDMLENVDRFIATVKHSKHRLFVWVRSVQLVSNAIELFARSDEFFFGVMHSKIHEVWGRAPGMGTQVRERESGFRYTPTTCFETFPFPEPTDAQRAAIASAAKELDELRSRWLNPPEWTRTETLEFPGSADGPWKRYVDPASVDERGIGTVRYPRLVPKDAECAKHLKKRTLTNLYNERPTWLDLAHRRLDESVFAAYGWDPAMSDDDLLAALLALNLERAAAGK